MKKILILTKGVHASSSRERALVYRDLMKNDMLHFNHFGLSKKPVNYLKAIINAPFFDIVFLQRKLVPKFFFKILRILSRKIIYDFDDAVFLNTKGKVSQSKLKRFSYICSNSDLILAGNEFLKKHSEKFNKKTFLIPTCLDISKYKIKTYKDKFFFDLVWIGSESTSKYLIKIIPILENANKKFKDLRIINISNVMIESQIIPIKNILWSELGQYKELRSAKVGLAPLDTSSWSKGKCAFKVLQYAAAGLPIISSDNGLNSDLIKKFKSGLLVKKENDWIKHIQILRSKQNLYKIYKKNAEHMAQKFDINMNYKKMKKIIRDVL